MGPQHPYALAAGILALVATPALGTGFQPINLVTDDATANPAGVVDPQLVNPWGVSFSGTSPFWVSDNGTGVSTLYRVNPATDAVVKQNLVVTIPGAGNVTGQSFNPAAASGAFNGDVFLFVSEDGTISGWRNSLGTTAEVLVTGGGGNLKGTALATVGGHAYLYSANFQSGAIDVRKGDAGAPDLAGNFSDPNAPSGYAPFNVRNLGNKLYVTYAKVDPVTGDDVAGSGNGFVNVFDLQGNLLARVATGGTLNSPWGLEIAPPSLGEFAGDLLVGNFGDGTINAYDPTSFLFQGQLPDSSGGAPLSIDGLWAITAGNNGGAGSSAKLYYTAGPNDESHGLFGVLRPVPDTLPTALALLVGGTLVGSKRRGAARV